MESSFDPIEPSAALNSSERVNPTNRSKADKDQKELARKFRKKSHSADEPDEQEMHEETEDLLELAGEITNTDGDVPESDKQDAEASKEPKSERRHIDLKA